MGAPSMALERLRAVEPKFVAKTDQRKPCSWPSVRDLFADAGDRGKTKRRRETAACAVCWTCPLRLECAQFALDTNQAGIWGATTTNDRLAWRRRGITRVPR